MTEATDAPRRSRKRAPDAAMAAQYDAAWQAGLPVQGPAWSARPWVDPVERAGAGKAAVVNALILLARETPGEAPGASAPDHTEKRST